MKEIALKNIHLLPEIYRSCIATAIEVVDENSCLELALLHDFANQNKPKQLLACGAELVAAAWLKQHNALVEPGEFDPQINGIIDLGLSGSGLDCGVEVKLDQNEQREFLMQGSRKDVGIEQVLKDHFGDEIRINFEWIGQRPSNQFLGRHRQNLLERFTQQLTDSDFPDISQSTNPPFADSIRISYSEQIDGQPVRFNVHVVGRGFHTIIQSRTMDGDGYGTVRCQLIKHAKHKAERTDQHFILVYVSLNDAFHLQEVDPQRLAYAWESLENDDFRCLPEQCIGVVSLFARCENNQLVFVPRGALRPGHITSIFDPLPSITRDMPANEVWTMVNESLADAIDRAKENNPDLAKKLAQYQETFQNSSCEDQNAKDVFCTTTLALSNNGYSLLKDLNLMKIQHMLPCKPNTMLPLRHREPRP